MSNYDPEKMDNAAMEAINDLHNSIPQTAYFQVAQWWKRHYLKAGHKRLGRAMVDIAKALEKVGIDKLNDEV